MKDFKLGNTNYKIITSIGEFPNSRKTLLRQYQRQVFEKIENDIFETYFNRVIQKFNTANWMGGVEELYNYRTAIRLKKINFDAFDMMFSLICLEEGEDKFNVDEDFLAKKIERMNKEGLTTQEAYDNVVFFCKSSPALFQDFLNLI